LARVQLSDVQAGAETLDVDEKVRFFADIYQRVAIFFNAKTHDAKMKAVGYLNSLLLTRAFFLLDLV
jgi:hypothetical protein